MYGTPGLVIYACNTLNVTVNCFGFETQHCSSHDDVTFLHRFFVLFKCDQILGISGSILETDKYRGALHIVNNRMTFDAL